MTESTAATYNSTATESMVVHKKFVEVFIADVIDRIYVPVLTIGGLSGNTLSFVTFLFSSLSGSSTSVYMAAIAILDSIILIINFGAFIMRIVGQTAFFMSSDWACGFNYFLFYFSIHLDVLLLVALTFDRFIVVKFPFKAQSLCTPRSATKVIASLGLFSFALNFQILFTRRMEATGRPTDPLKCFYPDPGAKFYMLKIYTWIDAAIYSFIPFISLFVLNIMIISSLKSSHRFTKQFKSRQGGNKLENSSTNVADLDRSSVNNTSQTEVSEKVQRKTSVSGCKRSDLQRSMSSDKNPSISTLSVSMSNTSASISSTSAANNPKTRSKRNKTPEGFQSSTPNTNANITIMLLLISFAFLILTSPVVISLLYMRYIWLPHTPAQRAKVRLLISIVGNLMYTNHAINFLLYCISGRRFRQDFSRLLTRVCCRG